MHLLRKRQRRGDRVVNASKEARDRQTLSQEDTKTLSQEDTLLLSILGWSRRLVSWGVVTFSTNQIQNRSLIGRARLSELSASRVYLLRVLIGSFCCLRLL